MTNYFNYFTEIEEHFQRARGTGLFLLSPVDWALIEAWKNAGIPLEAVLRGIDVAFEKWRARPARARLHQVNSLAYCTQAVTAEAQAMADGKPDPLVWSSDPNFRPSDVKMGPDGAIYFSDWHNPIIGHMQHNLRDPSRDREQIGRAHV